MDENGVWPVAQETKDAYARALARNFCKYCGHVGLRVEWRPKLVAKPLTSFSLAGAQLKTSAFYQEWPWAVCDGCGHESEGKR